MTKKEQEELVRALLRNIELDEFSSEEKTVFMDEAIAEMRKYSEKYKQPITYKFMRTTISFRDPVIDALEEMNNAGKEWLKQKGNTD